MYRIIRSEELAANIYLMDVEAPRVAKSCQPGQFVIVRMDAEGERIPLTICDYDREKGTITIVFQVVGAATEMMRHLKTGDSFQDFVGPLGCPSEFVNEDIDALKEKKILFVAGGLGTAPVYPQVKWLHERGIDADVIVGAKTKDLLIMEEEMKAVAGNLYITTDDGSYGREGNVCVPLNEMFAAGETFDEVIAIGPLIMMKFVVEATRPTGIPCVVSMNPIMIDGTGMCGGCRLTLNRDGKKVTKFACVDGPDFNGYEVDFDEAMSRGAMYAPFERHAHEETCNLFKKEAELHA